MLLFTLSATTGINLVPLHETVQLPLSYILSYHLRLTQIRSSPTVMHMNTSWTSFVGYLAGPLNYRLPDVRIHEHVLLRYGLYLKI
jgi:hypothetical protein